MSELLRVDREDWKAELPLIEKYFAMFGDHLPETLNEQLAALRKRLA
jgi:phosphoenolpyruvate carboxykinase (GTP)